ncbi:glutathione S-transferase family protein [Parvibaculum sp.]|uniref:glutathione S-transferase family protein n=1 Tax=Parvibaculum sp. TaxID=2024848 RepID=UPI002BB2BA15|nr:glutathione S-transferase family protein [Parvibaculum sp.]HUD53299.1 glutathione S-transferase family protein [Parvibaculum sp.]
MITLYEHPLSPYAQKVKIALREKGQTFELKMPGGIGAGGAAGEFADANPRAEVPVLIDGDVRIFDSTIILEYIEDRFPTPALLPKTPAERARVRMIEEVCDTHYEAINWGLGEIGWFRRAEGELAETLRERAAEQTEKLQAWLGTQLGSADWFNGASFGWGDLSVVPYVNASVGFGNGPDQHSPLGKWLARAKTRESVALTLKESAASIAGMEMVANVLEQGLFKREYRDHRLEWMVKSGGIDVVLKGLEKKNIRFTHFE